MATVHPFPASRGAELAMPCNVEAEAAFLGAVLIDNDTIDVAPDLRAEHFFVPVHGRIFERFRVLKDRRQAVTPVTLKHYFEADEGLRELGGTPYLARLTADGAGLLAPRDFAEQIIELAERRRLIESAQATIAAAQDTDIPLEEIALPARTNTTHGSLQGLDLATLAKVQAKPKAFAIDRLAPLGEVTLLSGPGSAGKSLLGQQFATAAAAGKVCLGLHVAAGPAIYITCEDDGGDLHWRQEHICRALGVDMERLAGRLHMESLRGELSCEIATFQHDGTLRLSTMYSKIDRFIARTGARLIFLDNLAHLFAGNENDRLQVTRFTNLLNRLAALHGAAIVLFGHTPKGKEKEHSGSTAWANAVRCHLTLEHDADTDLRKLTVSKTNLGRKGEALTFAWSNWAFVREDDLPESERSEHDAIVKAANDNALFLACLRERNRQQRAVSERSGANYAPKIFAGMPESKKIGKERLSAAMDRLFRLGTIERAELWRGKDRKVVSGLRETLRETQNGGTADHG